MPTLMARPHNKYKKTVIEKTSSRPESRSRDEREPKLHPDTRKSIWAIVFLALSAVFTLAAFEKAGPAGALLYKGLSQLLGFLAAFPVFLRIFSGDVSQVNAQTDRVFVVHRHSP